MKVKTWSVAREKKTTGTVVIMEQNTQKHIVGSKGHRFFLCCLPGSKIFTLQLMSVVKEQ